MKTGKIERSVSKFSTLLATISLPIKSKIPIAKSSKFTRVRFVQTKDWSKTSTHSKQPFRNVRLLQPTLNRLCSFPKYYDRTVSLKDLKLGILADITNRKVEFVNEIDPLNCFKLAGVLNNSRSS